MLVMVVTLVGEGGGGMDELTHLRIPLHSIELSTTILALNVRDSVITIYR